MFIGHSFVKRWAKTTAKADGIKVGNLNGIYIMRSRFVTVEIVTKAMDNKMKAVIVELFGELLPDGEYATYTIDKDGDPWKQQELTATMPEPLLGKEPCSKHNVHIRTILDIHGENMDYAIYQNWESLHKILCPLEYADAMSTRFLEEGERMPEYGERIGSDIFFRNETMAYRIPTREIPAIYKGANAVIQFMHKIPNWDLSGISEEAADE